MPTNSGQANYQVPQTTPLGVHLVKVYNGSLLLGDGVLKVVDVKPGLFTYNSGGTGTASGYLLKYSKTTFQPEGIIQLTPSGAGTRWNSSTQIAYLSLYGTGWRNGGTPTFTVNGVSVPVSFSGAHPSLIGVDQVNLGPLPDSLNTNGTKTVTLISQGIQSQANVNVTFNP
jgi:uncharacterized protein (TIGR03437 family)